MKIERLLEYARHRQVMEVRIPRADGQLEPRKLLPVGLVTPRADKPPSDRTKQPYVLGISWHTDHLRRFEHIADDQLLPYREGLDHSKLLPDDRLEEPWWADRTQARVHGYRPDIWSSQDDPPPVLVIGRNVMTALALCEAIAALTIVGGYSRFQYQKADGEQVRHGDFVGTGGKNGHLVYTLDHDRMKDGKPQLRSWSLGNILGLIMQPSRAPRWDGKWTAGGEG